MQHLRVSVDDSVSAICAISTGVKFACVAGAEFQFEADKPKIPTAARKSQDRRKSYSQFYSQVYSPPDLKSVEDGRYPSPSMAPSVLRLVPDLTREPLAIAHSALLVLLKVRE